MTGDPLGRGFPGAMTMMVVRSLVSNAAHTIGRNGNQPRSGSGNSKPNAPTGPRSGGSGSASNVNAPSHANGYHHSTSAQQNSANPAFNQESISAQTVAAQTDTVQSATEKMAGAFPQAAPAGIGKQPNSTRKTAVPPGTRRAPGHMAAPKNHAAPTAGKPRPAHRIVPQELLSPSWAARPRRIRSRNRPYIPSRNPIRAAAHRYRVMLARFRSVRQEKRQAKIHRALPFSRPVPQESRITAATHGDRRYRPNLRSSAVPLCRLRTRQAHNQQQIIRLRLLLRDPAWQENNQILIPHPPAIPQELVRGRSNQVARRIRQSPVQQERSARPSADAIPSPCSRRHAFPRMETPRSRSRTMFQPSSPAARCSRPAEPAWTAALQIGSILHPQCRHLRQHRLPTAKLVRLRARPRGLMRHVRQNSALRSAQFPCKAAAQKSHRKLLRIRLPLLPNGRAGNRPPRLQQAA